VRSSVDGERSQILRADSSDRCRAVTVRCCGRCVWSRALGMDHHTWAGGRTPASPERRWCGGRNGREGTTCRRSWCVVGARRVCARRTQSLAWDTARLRKAASDGLPGARMDEATAGGAYRHGGDAGDPHSPSGGELATAARQGGACASHSVRDPIISHRFTNVHAQGALCREPTATRYNLYQEWMGCR
jgi:hypothetical protein